MLRSIVARSILITLCLVLVASISHAGNRPPSFSAAVSATATVVNPIGLVTGDELHGESDQAVLIARFPMADGIQITIHQAGELTERIMLTPDEHYRTSDTYRLIQPSLEPLKSNMPSDSSSPPVPVVVTIMSISQ